MEQLLHSLTGLAFVVFIFGGGVISRALKTWERRMELQAERQQGQSDAITQQLQALRAEVAALRDTSTQFDMSLENSVQRLEQRVERLEIKSAARNAATVGEETSQPIGTR
jgi:ubiquinone biosynthesis protein UbiJ